MCTCVRICVREFGLWCECRNYGFNFNEYVKPVLTNMNSKHSSLSNFFSQQMRLYLFLFMFSTYFPRPLESFCAYKTGIHFFKRFFDNSMNTSDFCNTFFICFCVRLFVIDLTVQKMVSIRKFMCDFIMLKSNLFSLIKWFIFILFFASRDLLVKELDVWIQHEEYKFSSNLNFWTHTKSIVLHNQSKRLLNYSVDTFKKKTFFFQCSLIFSLNAFSVLTRQIC